MPNFVDQREIMFTQAMIDTPMDGWRVIKDSEGEDGKAIAIEHIKSKHRWELTEFDDLKQAWTGTRVA